MAGEEAMPGRGLRGSRLDHGSLHGPHTRPKQQQRQVNGVDGHSDQKHHSKQNPTPDGVINPNNWLSNILPASNASSPKHEVVEGAGTASQAPPQSESEKQTKGGDGQQQVVSPVTQQQQQQLMSPVKAVNLLPEVRSTPLKKFSKPKMCIVWPAKCSGKPIEN